MKPIIEMKNIVKTFSDNVVLDHVNFTLYEGETCALLGVNGAGKSTLIKILNGIYRADSGEIFFEGKNVKINVPQDAEKLGIRFVHQELNVCPDLTVAENIFLGHLKKNKFGFYDSKEIYKAAQELIDQLEIDIRATDRVGDLRAAEKQIIEILKAMTLNSKVLVLDEPTSSLSEKEKVIFFKLLATLKKKGVSFIFISHFLEDVLQISDRAIALKDAKNNGEFLTKEVTKEDLIIAMMGKNAVQKERIKQENKKNATPVLELRNLCSAGKFQNINLTAHSGMILGVCGLLGAGKSEIARAIYGLDTFDSGEIIYKGEKIAKSKPVEMMKRHVAIVTEDRKIEGFAPLMSISENITLSVLSKFSTKLGFIKEKERAAESLRIAKEMTVKMTSDKQKVESLSGGNQQKVIIGRCVESKPDLFILDEPTRGVDVYAKTEIYNILIDMANSGVAVLIFSSELEELLAVCTDIIVLRSGEIKGSVSASDINKAQLLSMIS